MSVAPATTAATTAGGISRLRMLTSRPMVEWQASIRSPGATLPDPHRIAGELQQLYSKPEYSARFSYEKQFGADPRRFTPHGLVKTTAQKLFSDYSLLDPVYVEERKGGCAFYRAFDGISAKFGTAMSLGSYWVGSKLVERIWKTTDRWSGSVRHETFMEFMRTASFVHSGNQMRSIARMFVPAGNSVVVIRGRGNWQALRNNRPGARKSLKAYDPFNNPQIETADDLLSELRMMPIPGEEQFNIPLFNAAWVRKVEPGPSWPLA